MAQPLVSGSWYRVAPLKPSLAAGVRIVRQPVRDQVWHVLVEPGSGRQLRLNPAAYAFAGRCDAVAAHIRSQFAGTRDQHAEQIGHRCAGHEQATRGVGKFEQLAQPVCNLPLDLDRHVIAAAKIGVQAGGQHLRQHAGHIAAAMHPTHEAGMGIAGGVRENMTHELVMHGGEIARPGRHDVAKARALCVRNRLPHRALADILDVVENIVEHAVALRAGAAPIGGIEAAAGNREGFCRHAAGKVSLID